MLGVGDALGLLVEEEEGEERGRRRPRRRRVALAQHEREPRSHRRDAVDDRSDRRPALVALYHVGLGAGAEAGAELLLDLARRPRPQHRTQRVEHQGDAQVGRVVLEDGTRVEVGRRVERGHWEVCVCG